MRYYRRPRHSVGTLPDSCSALHMQRRLSDRGLINQWCEDDACALPAIRLSAPTTILHLRTHPARHIRRLSGKREKSSLASTHSVSCLTLSTSSTPTWHSSFDHTVSQPIPIAFEEETNLYGLLGIFFEAAEQESDTMGRDR